MLDPEKNLGSFNPCLSLCPHGVFLLLGGCLPSLCVLITLVPTYSNRIPENKIDKLRCVLLCVYDKREAVETAPLLGLIVLQHGQVSPFFVMESVRLARSLRIWCVFEKIVQRALQGIADRVQLRQTHTVCEVLVQVVDGVLPDACLPTKLRLRDPPVSHHPR